MRKFWQKRKGLIVLVGVPLLVAMVAMVVYAQPPGGGRGPGGGGMGMGDWQNRMAMGTVAQVKGDQVVVKDRNGQTKTVTVGGQARITRFAKGTAADLKQKTIASVVGKYDAKRAWFIPERIQIGEGVEGMGPQGIMMGVGQITSVKNNQVYLTLPLALSKQTQIIRGDRIPVSKIKVGEQIFATGEPGANNTVNAQRVVVGNLEAMRMGGGRMGGPGGGMRPRTGGGQRNR